MDWVLEFGKYNYDRWRNMWLGFFEIYQLIHNTREIKKIEISKEGDGAFAVVDINALWIDTNGNKEHWKGRACKVYSKVGNEWKMTMHTGVLEY